MSRYNPDRGPDAETWLALDEQERIMLVEQYHRRRRIQLPNRVLHATIHVVVENQLAMREPVVVEVCARLQAEGLERHDAIHAIGSILAEQIHSTLSGEVEGEPNKAYFARLRELTAEKWLAG